MLRYTVNHGFARNDVWYTRENADQVKELPRSDRDELIALGHITEHHDGAPADSAQQAATPVKGGK